MAFRIAKKFAFNQKFLFTIFLILLFMFFVKTLNQNSEEGLNLKNILSINSTERRNIFFIETSFSDKHDKVFLKKREACSVESAALMNPDAQIHVIFVTNSKLLDLETVQWMEPYENVGFYRTDLSEFSLNTPAEDWIESKALYKTNFLKNNISNILRLLLLWRYGGTYFDLDVISQTSLDSIGENNFIVAQNNDLSLIDALNNAIISLDSESGHQIAERLVKGFTQYYNGTIWSWNGPVLVTRIIRSYCNFEKKNITEPVACANFIIFPMRKGYELKHTEAKNFMNEELTKSTMERINGSYFVHFWNLKSKMLTAFTNSSTAYVTLAKKFCPNLLQYAGESF